MILTFDNLNGLGAVDYSAAVDRSEPLTITRTLNEPTIVKGMLCLESSGLQTPVRQARVTIASDAGTSGTGTLLFTGYLTTEPVAVYAGVASEGPVYRLAFSAVSDEWLLDKQAAAAGAGVSLASSAGAVLKTLMSRVSAGRLNTAALANGRAVGFFAHPGASFSAHAGALASTTYASYRALNGALNLTLPGDVVHVLSESGGEGGGTLSVAALKTASVRELANDVTVTGAMEAAAYWTELFLGDGSTTVFDLTGEPAAPNAGHATLVDDDFEGTVLNAQTWAAADPGGHLSLSGGTSGTGLQLTGGNGQDGQTTLQTWDALELGGTVVIELGNVTLGAGSAGFLAGLYTGSSIQADCFASFQISQSGGSTLATPLVYGVATGTPFPLLAGHFYTLRLHVHAPEMERVRQNFYAMTDGVVDQFGGGLVGAPVSLVFEVRDVSASSNTPVTVLYDGTVANGPASVFCVPVNSLELYGSIGSVKVARTGSAWLTGTDPSTGIVSTRLAGATKDGVDCTVSSSVTGRVTFLPGRVPAANEFVTVSYRGRSRAVARLADAASIAAEAAGGGVGTARWLGEIVRPLARSSADCEAAAQAILSFAANRAAAVTGSYTLVNPAADIWPGDLLALTANEATTNVIVRRVQVEEQGAVPEATTYRIGFANDWAEGLGITLSEEIAADALLPTTALSLPSGTSAPVLANLQQIAVTSTTTVLDLDAGLDPPAGGGFEVRRRDGGFGAGPGATGSGDLVLRSPVRHFTIARAAFEETFFIRMYDASTPPLYSRWSCAIVTHLPTS